MSISAKPFKRSQCAYLRSYTGVRYVIEPNPCYDDTYYPVWCWDVEKGFSFEVPTEEIRDVK